MMSAITKDAAPTLISLFERQAARTPDATALIDGALEISFRRLDAMARHAAVRLRQAGIAPGDRVGHCFKRSTDAIAALIAILRVGAAYVPIATDAPAPRRDFMLQDSGAKGVICGGEVAASLASCPVQVLPWTALEDEPHAPGEPLADANVGPTSIAWVLYTSGSSGQPKGVLGSHKGCVARLQALWKQQPFQKDERCFQHTAFTTVDSFWEIFAPLCAGHALHVVGEELIKDPERLLPHLATLGIRRICMVPSLLALLVDLFPSLHAVVPDLKLWVVSGEPLTLDLCARFRGATRDARLFNQYGLTESCADITAYDASAVTTIPMSEAFGTCLYAPIGRPFEGTELFIVDEQLCPVQDGTAGELCIVGDCLSDGYLGRPELMEERFFMMPGEGTQESRRALRTGDRVVRLPEGDLLYLGRIDSQINLRGYRIEPGEVEAAIATHEDIVQAAVVLQEIDALRKHLVAFVTLRPAVQATVSQDISDVLKRHAEARLPAYMLPGAFVVVDAMPLTPTGKVDRRVLATTRQALGALAGGVSAERGTERVVAEVFAAVLKLERVGATDNFFDIGGNSLIAMQTISGLRARLGVNLPMSSVFEAPTVRTLAMRIDQMRTEDVKPGGRLMARPPTAVPLMSSGQERLWFFERLWPGTATYTISWNLRMRGMLDRDALARALAEILQRHDVLRTHFVELDGLGVQVIRDVSAVTLETRSVAEDELPLRLKECSNLSFDLENGPLHHFTLFELAPDDHCLSVVVHHAVFDGWSVQVMAKELCTLYAAFTQGRPSPLPPLVVQFADYAHWQREWLDEQRVHDQVAYWRAQLLGAPAALELPTDRPRPAVASYRGAHVPFSLPADTSQALRELARREGATLFMVLLAALNVVLGRWSGQSDIVVGSPIAGRNQRETEPMIGFFVNTLALRTDLSGDPSFSALLQRVRRTALDAYAHQDLPFEKLVEALQPVRDLSRQAVFQVMLALHPEPAALSMPKLRLNAWEGQSASTKFDLALELVDATNGIHGAVEFATDLWDGVTAERFANHFENILAAVTREPAVRISALALMGEDETRTVLRTWNDTAEPYPQDQSIAELFEAQVARTPHATALYVDGTTLSYAELDARAGRLAAHLQELGVGPDALVGLCVARSVDMVVGLLAILKAGGAYVPIDPDYPADRISYMLVDSDVKVLVTQAGIARHLPDSPAPRVLIDEDWPLIAAATGRVARERLDAHHLAYVIYTSGSTGRPKGVMISHYGILNHLSWMQRTHRLTADDRVLQNAPISFDVSVWQLFWPLLNGAGLVITKPGGHRDMDYIVDLVDRAGVTIMHMVPSMIQALLDAGHLEPCGRVRDFIVGGEALTPPLQNRFLKEFGCRLHNQYGPTETSVEVSAHQCQPLPTNAIVPIGKPLSNTQLYVLDPHLTPCPVGVPGELYIAGVGLARGYLKRPDLTAERFVPNPFGHGTRMYKTGDLVRWNAAGTLEYLGRMDHQVKIRGFRIETGEIEAALLECTHVRQALVLACDDHRGQLQLVAYVVGDEVLNDETVLFRHLKAMLPEHMIPASFMRMEQMPLMPNGKVDRKALPTPALPPAHGAYVAPRTSMEQSVAAIFAEVLQLDRVGAEDDFFRLGGHSLLAMRLVASVRKTLGRELPLRDLFEGPTVALLARQLELIATDDFAPIPALHRSNRVGPLPLSFAQERLWFLDRLGLGGITYNVPWILRMDGAVDVQALELAIAEVLHRHDSLRTRFEDRNGRPMQIIDALGPFSLPVHRLSPERLDESLQAFAERRFDLATGPLCKFDLLQTSATMFHLSFVAHHIICDGWSVDLMAGELCALYEAFAQGRPSPLQPLAVQFADYANWQREWLNEQRVNDQLAYWRQQLQGAPAALELPTDRPRPAVASYRGAHVPFSLGADASQALRDLTHREGVTLFMVLLAALNVVLSRWSGQNDIVVGSPIAGRTQRETEPMIGFFVNTLALRTDLSGDPSFSALLQRVRRTALDAFAHQDLPFEKLVEALQPERDLSRQAVFQVMLALHTPQQSPTIPGLTLEAREGRTPTAKFDLSIEVSLHRGLLHASIEYASDLYDHATIERLVEHYRRVLELVAENPECRIGQLQLLTSTEREQQLVTWNSISNEYRDGNEALHHLIESHARLSPQAVALVYEDGLLNYSTLNRRANQLARHLRAQGIGPDTLVALCLRRTPEMIVALLGILKAGAAYVPLDPAHPRQRLAYMLGDTASPLLLTQQALLDHLGELNIPVLCLDRDAAMFDTLPDHDLNLPVHPDQLAYCIYTSGSTGQPKGAMVSHRGIASLRRAQAKWFGTSAADRVLQFASIGFDAFVFDWVMAFGAGGALVLRTEDVDKRLVDWVIASGVTIATLPPALLTRLSFARATSLRYVISAGEACRPEHIKAVPPSCRFVNAYGPTETTIWATAHHVAGETITSMNIPIGTPVAGLSVYILDEHLSLLPVGAIGQIHIAGAGLARGYLNRPDITAEKFVPNPYGEPGSRMYRTGDLGRYRGDGSIEYIGRNDHQIKLRGLRIELGEIEGALLAANGVREAAVLARNEPAGDTRLIAYLALHEGHEADATLRHAKTQLRAQLPEYMIPAAWVVLPALPLNASGKIDRRVLPEPQRTADDSETYIEPVTDTQKLLAHIWSELFHVDRVGLNDSFFALGGHSLLAVQTLWLVEQRVGVQVPVRELFEAPTVLQLASRIDGLRQGQGVPACEP